MSWAVVFLNSEVKAEFLSLPADIRAGLTRIFVLIENFGLTAVGMPHARHVQGQIWEMRGRGKSGIGRSLYVAHLGQQVVILRSFIKKTQKTPNREIRVALWPGRRSWKMERALDLLPKMLEEADFKKAWDELEEEYELAALLIEARRNAGITQAEAARRMGVSGPVIARIESGRDISIRKLKKYASAIGQPISLVINPG